MNESALFILVSSFGAICQELLHWYEIRSSLHKEEFSELLKSFYYWLFTIAMIVITGFATYILFHDHDTAVALKVPFILGAAFPTLFKKVVGAVSANTRQDLGKSKFDWAKDLYFRL